MKLERKLASSAENPQLPPEKNRRGALNSTPSRWPWREWWRRLSDILLTSAPEDRNSRVIEHGAQLTRSSPNLITISATSKSIPHSIYRVMVVGVGLVEQKSH
ncbi:hypothetical protein CEXT_794221 [Caerostris extrusa]|uniref:Uncharacterized protein n=1 Tax=Caerostris extrusa TaxID=172846 RepID=A0AAV4SRM7_CAEEX|nr:hypothetical protein CEXT_794221 [Caerostris extrusa]